MKKITLLIAAASLMATASYGALAQTVTATGNPSTDGWTSVNNEFFKDSTDWALFGTGGNAVYTFGDLGIGESAAINFQLVGGVGTGDYVGLDFQDGGTTGIGFNFQGGGSNFNVFDFDNQVTDSGIGFTNSFQTIKLTNVDNTNYTLSIGGTDFTGLQLNGGTAIDSMRIFNDTTGVGNDVAFNNLNVVPEPETFALLAGLLALASIATRRRK
jgi:hypothetical protein